MSYLLHLFASVVHCFVDIDINCTQERSIGLWLTTNLTPLVANNTAASICMYMGHIKRVHGYKETSINSTSVDDNGHRCLTPS